MLVQNGAYKEYVKLDKRYGINNDGRPDSFHEILRLFIIDSENQYKYFDTITWRYILVYIDQITAKLDKYPIGNDFNADYPEFIKVLEEIISEVQSEDIKYSILIDRLVKESQSAVVSFKGYSTLYKDLVDNGEITRANFEKYIDNAVLSSMGQSIAMYVYSMTSKIKMLTNYDMNDVINDGNITWMLYALLDIIPVLDNIKDTKYIKDIHNFALKLSKNISDETFIDIESYEKWYENEYDDEPYNPYTEDVYDDWLAYHKGLEEKDRAEDSDVDVNASLEELKNSLHEMKAILTELKLDNKLDKMADKINKLEVKILSLDNLNSIHNQSSETDSEEDDDYDEYWDDTSENYDEYYEYKEYNEDEDDDYDEYDEDSTDITDDSEIIIELADRLIDFYPKADMGDFKIILDSINNMDGNPIKISNDLKVSISDYAYGTPIKNMFLDYYYMMFKVLFDNCLKLIDLYAEFRNDVHKNLRYKLSVDELADFDKALQYFMTDDNRFNECGNDLVQEALNYVIKLNITLTTYRKFKTSIEIIKSSIRILSSLQRA